MTNTAYQTVISRFNQSRVLVIGDIILDVYLKGDSSRLSPEAPVPVVNVLRKEMAAGGAANIALNLRALDAEVVFLSSVGSDEEGLKAISILAETGIDTDYIIREAGRKTMVKSRVMAQSQILARFDYGTPGPVSQKTEEQLSAYLREKFDDFDLIVIGDYYGSILTPPVIYTIAELQKKKPKFLAVDSKALSNFRSLKPSLVKPNYFEAIKLAGLPYQPSERIGQVKEIGDVLYEQTGAALIALTLDADGALIFEKGKAVHRSYAYEVQSPNVIGAGDTYISAYVLSLHSGADIPLAAEIASAASAIAVQKEDTAPCYTAELKTFFSVNNKIINSVSELQKLAEIYRNQGRKIVFTNGCFDILHSGHVSYLNQAKELGDVLIVGLNCDESVKRLKGAERPINPLADRMEVLSGLSAIDHLIAFGEVQDTPVELIRAAKPDVYAKGGDYTKETLPETKIVEELGGEIVFVPYVPDHSTTRIIHRINRGKPMKLMA